MKMKFSIIAAVLAAGFASQANASIVNVSGLSADQLFLSVWDPVAQASYTRGLGLTGANMISGAGISFGTSTTGSGFTATGDTTHYTLAADANLTSFLTTYAADAASLQWNVIGGNGSQPYGTIGGVFATSNSMTTGWSSSYFTTITSFSGNYLNAVNGLMPVGSVAGNTDSVIATSATGGTAYALSNAAAFGAQLGGTAPFNTAAALGVSQGFYLLNPTTNARNQYVGAAGIYQFANAATGAAVGNAFLAAPGTASTWVLGTNGTLTYTTASVAAVPEPSEIGLMLSGFGLVGFLANKRRKALKG